ncbi:abortive infection family protein [Pseudomonas baetica]|uniref:abortive infection family protein n=1 Tax=Pseudomonas baetica TaxID=674054 RepID=UPI003EE8C090
MANNDGLSRLASLTTKLKNERRLLLEKLEALEKKLVDSMGELGCYGTSNSVMLESWFYEESDRAGTTTGWLAFDGSKLIVRTEKYEDGWPEPDWNEYSLKEISPEWQVLLSRPVVLESLIDNISSQLEAEHDTITNTNERLTEYVAAEKAAIDADLEQHFEQHPTLLESWQKAQKAVEVDPEDSIARSCSHAETVMKTCLKQLGDTGYEGDAVQGLTSRVVKKLRGAGCLDEGSLQSLKGISTIFHGIGTLRNSSSTAHGKNAGYTPPTPVLAQLVNHLSGAGSAFVLKQTEKVVQGEQKPE